MQTQSPFFFIIVDLQLIVLLLQCSNFLDHTVNVIVFVLFFRSFRLFFILLLVLIHI